MNGPALRAAVALVALGVALALGCSKVDPRADGSPCGGDEECKSRKCDEGFCSGEHACSTTDGGCEPGWVCEVTPPPQDFVSVLTGADGSSRCVPTCGSCPPTFHCPKNGADGTTKCRPGLAPLDVQIVVDPAEPRLGVPTTFRAEIANANAPITKYEWQFAAGGFESSAGPEIVKTFTSRHTFALDPQYYNSNARVLVTDVNGRHGRVEKHVTLGCGLLGSACLDRSNWCCEGGENARCATRGAVTACEVVSPPTATIECPSTAKVGEKVVFTVVATSEWRTHVASWKFDEYPYEYGTGTNTETRALFGVGAHVVEAKVTNEHGVSTVARTTIEITE